MEACLAVPANSRLAKVANCDKTARRCTAGRGLDIAARNISHKVLEPEVMQQLVCCDFDDLFLKDTSIPGPEFFHNSFARQDLLVTIGGSLDFLPELRLQGVGD